jgi:hypothetical protein
MAGTKIGGQRAAQTNKDRYGLDYFKKIGSKGGTKTHQSGKLALVNFSARREDARIYGAIGGKISRRSSKKPD